MCNTELGKFCKGHADWQELLTQEPYCLKIKEDGPYTMFSYDQIRSNFNIKLLRQLSENAPGTFQHSMQVSNLAAAAANKVGASSLLVRTGALYHDIGKLENPVFFTENQGSINPHACLPYEQSAQIIIDHVRNGLRMASD